MALRKIVTKEDPILYKVCKPVEVFDDKLASLIDDMIQTLKKAQGVPQENLYNGSRRGNYRMCKSADIENKRKTESCGRLSVMP